MKLFNSLNLKENDYILINNQSSSGKINIPFIKNIINTEKRIIYTDKLTDNIFDWCYIIENATEIHTICSAFKHLMDSLNLNKCEKLVYYTIKSNNFTKSKNNWIYV